MIPTESLSLACTVMKPGQYCLKFSSFYLFNRTSSHEKHMIAGRKDEHAILPSDSQINEETDNTFEELLSTG